MPTMIDREFQDVQLYVDFSKEVTGQTRLPDNVLYANLEENGVSLNSNVAVSFAKLYTWAVDIFDFSPSGTNKIMIKPSAIPSSIDTTYAFQEGSTAGAFQVKEGTGAWQTIAVHGVPTIDGNGKILETFLPPTTLPIASGATLGGIKVGNGLQIDANGVLSIDTSTTPIGTMGRSRALLNQGGTALVGNITELEVDE